MELSDPLPKFLVTRVGVDRGRQRTHMPREPLRQEQISRTPIDVRDGRMPQCMEGIEPVEPGFHLPRPEGELYTPWGDPAPSAL